MASPRLALHYCSTSDGMRIGCVCSTGRDHTEDEMDLDPNAAPLKACCVDAEASPPEEIVHTLGCRNRCGVYVPVEDYLFPGGYPCGTTKGHEGDHWVHPTLTRAAAGSQETPQ